MFSSQAHPPPPPDRKRSVLRGAMLAALAVLGATQVGCSSDTVRTLAVDAGYGPKAVTTPEFVTESRSKQTPDFMNVGVDAPKRATRAKSAEGQKALQAELEDARGRNEVRGRAAESAGKGTAKAVKPAPAVPEAD